MSELFNPDREVKLRDGTTVRVSELAWPDALSFFRKLREQAQVFVNDKGELELRPDRILEAVGGNLELAAWLVTKTTGRPPEWLDTLKLSEMLDVVGAALEANLGIIADRLKNARGRLASILPAGAPTSK